MIELPQPEPKGLQSLEELLMNRDSQRDFLTKKVVKLEFISQFLWAGYGNGKYGRTVPSAGAYYPLRLYLVAKNVKGLDKGVYRYEPHYLEPISGDVKGFNYYNAPCYIVISADETKTVEKYGKRGYTYVLLEAGHSAQNIALQAQSCGLGTVMVGAFDDKKVQKVLKNEFEPIYIIPIGQYK